MIAHSEKLGDLLVKMEIFAMPNNEWRYRATARLAKFRAVQLADVHTRALAYYTLKRKGTKTKLLALVIRTAEKNYEHLTQTVAARFN